MGSSPFLTYDVRKPSESAAEWLTQITKDRFNRDELFRISRRIEFTEGIVIWIDRTLVNPTETGAVQLNEAVGLDASDDELPVVVEAAASAWIQVIGELDGTSSPSDGTDEESLTDKSAAPDDSNPTDTAADIPSELRFVSRLDDRLEIGDGETLSRYEMKRAWKIQGQDWQIEDSGTDLTTAVLAAMLRCDSRRDNEQALADQFRLRLFEEPPNSNWKLVPGFRNLYYNKHNTAAEKRGLLERVANNLVFDPPAKHPLRKDGKIEWWLPKMNA